MNERPIKLLYTIDETAESLGISRSYVYLLIQDGEIERVKIGRRALITAGSLQAFVERLEEVRRDDDLPSGDAHRGPAEETL